MVGHPWRFLDDVNSSFLQALSHLPTYLPTYLPFVVHIVLFGLVTGMHVFS